MRLFGRTVGREQMKNIIHGRSGRWVRRCILFLLDLVFVFIAMQAAITLRYEGHVTPSMYARLMRIFPELLGVYAICSIAGGVYDMVWRYAGSTELMRLSAVYGFSAAITLALA